MFTSGISDSDNTQAKQIILKCKTGCATFQVIKRPHLTSSDYIALSGRINNEQWIWKDTKRSDHCLIWGFIELCLERLKETMRTRQGGQYTGQDLNRPPFEVLPLELKWPTQTKQAPTIRNALKHKTFAHNYLIGGKQWQTTPKNLPRMRCARATPVTWLGSGSCQPGL